MTTVNVLLVMDGVAGSFHYASFGPGDPSALDQYFGLSEFVATLAANTMPVFTLTKAHRETDVGGAADIEGFRFDQHDLSVYDEIFLFGVAPAPSPGQTDFLPTAM